LKNNAESILDKTAVSSFTNGLMRNDLIEFIGRNIIETLSHLMEVVNSWADGEELVHNEYPRAYEDDGRYANDNHRRYNNDAGQRKYSNKRKGRGYDEIEHPEMVAAEFPTTRGNEYRRQGREQAREPARDQGRERGRDQRREWHPKKIGTNGLPPS
jgi:hypothetical protein